MMVNYQNNCGPLIPVVSGVPQGSILGPFLCASFLGSVLLQSQCARLIKYADDMTVIERIDKNSDSSFHVDDILRQLRFKKMLVSCNKSKQMVISRSHNARIILHPDFAFVDSISILGVILNNNLSWDAHFDNVCLSASRRLYALKRLRHVLTRKQLLQVFVMYVQAMLLYASPLFCELSYHTKKNINCIHKRAHRIICNVDCKCDVIPAFEDQRVKQSMSFLLKCEYDDHPLNYCVPRRLFYTNHFCLPTTRTARRGNSFFSWVCALYNRCI